MQNPDITALAAYPGEYQKTLFRKLFMGFKAADDILLITNVKNSLNMHKLVVKGGPKPFTGEYLSKGGEVAYEPRVLTVEAWQRDINIKPSEYRTTFMAAMRGAGENPGNKTIPFAQFMWETITLSLASQLNNAVYGGVGKAAYAAYGAGTVYNPGDRIKYTQDTELRYFKCLATTVAGQNPDTTPAKWALDSHNAIFEGFAPKIAALAALGSGAGGIDPVTTGVVTSASGSYAQFKKLWRSQSEEIKMRGATVFCSVTDKEILTDDFEDKVGKFTEIDNGITYLAGTEKKCVIKAVSWLAGYRRLLCTDPNNLVIGTDILSDQNSINTIEKMYSLDAGYSGVLGVQIQDPEALRVSDQI